MPCIGLATTAITIALTLLLSGCALAPGMTMSEPLQTHLPGWPEPQQGPSYIPITAELVAEQAERNASRPENIGAPSEASQTYLIGAGDALAITVWGHPDLNAPDARTDGEKTTALGLHVVHEDGSLFFPWAGKINAAGKTAEQLRVMLSEALRRVIKNPQVSLRISHFNSQGIYVGGEVEKPGRLAISDLPMRVADAINSAGGATELGNTASVLLQRDEQHYHLNLQGFYDSGDARHNPYLKDGDILKVASLEDNRIFVMGEVVRPGQQLLGDRRISLTEALASAGGPDQTSASTAHIYVIRDQYEKQTVFRLNARSADMFSLASQFQLEPRDVLFVDAAGITRWNRFVSQILPSATALQRASATDFPLFNGQERAIRR